MSLEQLCDYIVLAGAVVMAVYNIIKVFAKPTSIFKRKKEKEYSENLKRNLDNLIPKYLEEHDLETRDRYLADRQRYLQEITNEVLSNIKCDLNIIKDTNKKQNETIDILRKQAVDVLRQKIEKIYYDYRDSRELPRFALENLEELYSDYKKGGGNHHIDKLYSRMKTWKIIEQEPEYERE